MAFTAATLILNLVTGMLTARLLGATGRGELTAITTAPIIIAWSISLGCGPTVSYFQSKDPTLARSLLPTWLAIILPVGLIGVLAGEALLPALLAQQSDLTLTLARLYLPIILILLVNELVFGIVLGDQDFLFFNATTVLQPAIVLLSLLALLATSSISVAAAALTTAAATVMTVAIAATRVFRRHGIGKPNRSLATTTVRYGLPAQMTAVGRIVSARFDLLVLPSLIGAAFVGQYSVAASVAGMLTTLASALSTIIMPAAAKRAGGGRVLIKKALRLTLALGTIGGVALALIAPVAVPVIYGGEFSPSVTLILILLPGCVFWAGASILVDGLLAEGRPVAAAISVSLGVTLTIFGIYTFVPSIGVAAAAIVSSVSYTAVFFLALALYVRNGKSSHQLRSLRQG